MKLDTTTFLQYYNKGLTDSDISRITRITRASIAKLRKSLGLALNKPKASVSLVKFKELYLKGYTDKELGVAFKVSSSTIRRHRCKLGLPLNIKPHALDSCFLGYFNQGFDDVQIAKLTGISKSAVQAYRTKLGLAPVSKSLVNDKLLNELYAQGRTDSEIAAQLGCSPATVAKHRQVLGLVNEKHIITSYQYNPTEWQVILGSLLGDGCLSKPHKNGGVSLRITHCVRQREYLEYKYSLLKGNSWDIREYRFYDKRRKGSPYYSSVSFYTKSTKDLVGLYNRWYTPKKEVCKEDIYKIGPLGLAIWYMDDGYNPKDGGICLATHCFSMESLVLIQQMFKDKFSISVTVYSKSHITYIPAKEAIKFKSLVEPYIVPCMRYKIQRSHSKTPLNGETPKC